ncbi:MAG TPA: GDSL-type esterase/lipase family protein [Candidatus Paceibacterota bacterium]|nr:GDSL-type esterase/lipase family protein [Candidatus Paceibacterota bacterium]
MNNKFFRKFLLGSVLTVATIGIAFAQPGPGAPGGRGGGRGFFGFGQFRPPGPPAPVPPEVAIPRPTAEDIARLNADLKKFVDRSPDKKLKKEFASLITVQLPRENTAIRPTRAGGGQHQTFVNIAKTNDFDVMFLGDSITYLWTVGEGDVSGYPGGKTVFDKYFAGMKIANFGIPGDTTQGVLWRLQNGEGQGHKPKAVMLLIGTNNNGNTPEEIAEGVGADVLELRKDFPDAKILLMAIFPRGTGPNDPGRRKMEAANKIIARLDDQKHVFFMNINSKFLDDQGHLIGFRPTDHLHPVVQGFDIWASSVAPTLKNWID